jgi:hypothetical protein
MNVVCKLSGASIGDAPNWRGVCELVKKYTSGELPSPQILSLGAGINCTTLLARNTKDSVTFPVFYFEVYNKGVN